MDVSKNEIKFIKSLSQKKFRDESGMFVAEGEKLVAEAVASNFEIVNLYRMDDIGEEAMGRITSLASPSPALAVIRKPREEKPSLSGLVLALDSLRDPGNVGTIIRLADWYGIREIIASEDTVDIFNPKVVQATMGAIFRVRFHYCDLVSTIRESGKTVYGTFLDGENIYDADLKNDGIIIMGSERDGISRSVSDVVTERLFIPPYPGDGPTSESLNVAIATAITCSEFRRRIQL